jgi:prevent-host-death family protein
MIERGIKEARQDFTKLLKQVRQGEEILITDRSKPIARIVPVERQTGRPLGSRASLRASVPRRGRGLSDIVSEERERH